MLRRDLKVPLGEVEEEKTISKVEIVCAKASGGRKQDKYKGLNTGQCGWSPESNTE